MAERPDAADAANPATGSVRYVDPEGLNKNPAFSNVVVVEGPVRTVYVGGQDSVDASGNIVGKGDIAAQTIAGRILTREDAPVPNTEYTEQYADTYSNDGYYDQGYAPEETNGYTYGYEEEEDELRRITTIHPRSYNDAKIIGEAFRENIPVIMNVEEMPDADAKRLVDFASGLAFALEGRIERVTSKVFLLTPSNLEVLGVANSENTADFNSEGEFPFDQG